MSTDSIFDKTNAPGLFEYKGFTYTTASLTDSDIQSLIAQNEQFKEYFKLKAKPSGDKK